MKKLLKARVFQCATLTLVGAAVPTHAQWLIPLGVNVNPSGVTLDGTVVGGSPSGAFRRLPDGTQAGFSGSSRSFTSVAGVSSDGTVAVGFYLDGGLKVGRWTSATGVAPIGSPEIPGLALGVSSDGSRIVGQYFAPPQIEGFHWTATGGLVLHGDLPGGDTISATAAVSDNGVAVGQTVSANGPEAFRWTEAGGIQGLGDLPGSIFSGEAKAVSADGSVIVGNSLSGAHNGSGEAFRWTEATGMIGLGAFPHSLGIASSAANDITADGSVIVGSSSGEGTTAGAFLWRENTGMVALWDQLAAQSVDPAQDSWTQLTSISQISDDGRYVVGTGFRNGKSEGFLADLGAAAVPEPGTYAIAFAVVLGGFAAIRRRHSV